MSQSLMQSNFKDSPDASMRSWRPLSKISNMVPGGDICLRQSLARLIPGTSVLEILLPEHVPQSRLAGLQYFFHCRVSISFLPSFLPRSSICDRWNSERPHEVTCPIPNRLHSGDICTAAEEFGPIHVDYISNRDWQYFACVLEKVARPV
jgi:hypothetical protein